MKRNVIYLYDRRFSVSFVAIVACVLAVLSPDIVFAQTYEGAEFCQDCHESQYSEWRASGHPFKLMKGTEARNRPIPLPQGFKWDDISYVIGGYQWKSRYVDNDGYVITTTFDKDGNEVPGHNQYNYLTGTWSDYHAGEVDKPYNCGKCHTTGWIADEDHATDNDLSDNQDGLPGMHGTFEAGGVECEACHGPGFEMEIDRSSELCGSCHIRGDKNTIPAKGGFIRHHEQYNEILASPHEFGSCVICHDPHKRAEFSIKVDCAGCHETVALSYAKNAMSDYGVECIDCHMPYATKSAQALGDHQGDLKTHLFSINTDPTANMFTPDGGFVALDSKGKGAVTLDFACKRCHKTAELAELAKFAKNFHNQNLDEIGLNPGLTGIWGAGKSRDGEGFNVEVAYSNGVLTLIVFFYTYDNFGNQVFLMATGPVTTGTSTEVTVYITEGPMWGDDFDPAAVVRTLWGTGTFDFPKCTLGNASMRPNQAMKNKGFTDYLQTLVRDLTVSGIQCPTFVNNPN